MKRILKTVGFILLSAVVVDVVLIGIATYFTPDIEKRKEEDEDYDCFVDPELENEAWKMD